MQIKTITTAAGVNEIDFGNDDSQTTAHFYWFKNLSNSTLYVSAMPDPVAGEDNVAELSAKSAASVETDEGKVYVLGAGKVEIHRTNSKFCPFELPSSGSGGGGGGSITVDSELSETSENPLQNKAITAAINEVKSELDTKSDVNHIHDITASGNPVTLTNLQGRVPFSEMVVSGKNLIGVAQSKGLVGDNTNGYSVFGNESSRSFIQKLNPNTTYCIKKYDSGNRFRIVAFNNEPTSAADKTAKQLIHSTDGSVSEYTFTTKTDYLWIVITTHFATSGDAVEPIVQLEYGSSPTEYEPPITSQEITVTRFGKNLLQKMANKTIGGLDYLLNDDGSVSVTGTQTAENYPNITSVGGMLLKSGNYTLSGGTERLQITALDIGANTIIAHSKINPATFSIDTDKYVRIYVYSGSAYNGQTFDDVIYPQLELGDTATEYESYHTDTISIAPTSNPYIIQNDLLQYDDTNTLIASIGELEVVGVQKNAAVKRIWDNMGMDLLFDGVTDESNPALIDIKDYSNIVVSVTSKYSDDIINIGTIIMAVGDIITSISDGIKRYLSTGSRAAIINITGTINNCAIVFAPHNTGDAILNCKIYGIK